MSQQPGAVVEELSPNESANHAAAESVRNHHSSLSRPASISQEQTTHARYTGFLPVSVDGRLCCFPIPVVKVDLSLFRLFKFVLHSNVRAFEMNPESDAALATKIPRRKKVFQRRLHDQLSESRMLEVLDRKLQHPTSLSNQEEDMNNTQSEDEEELVCVSKMVKVTDGEPVIPKSSKVQVGGVLKTVRYIHIQRAMKPVQHENQTEH